MKKILVPIDFSEISINALKVAAEIATKEPKSLITLVHVYEKPIYGVSLQIAVDTKKLHELQEKLTQQMHKVFTLPFLKGLEVKSLILADIEIWDILNHEKVGKQDLVVMGSHGVKGIKEFFIGSNTEKLIRVSDVPVLTIKKSKKNIQLKSMVYASDFGKEAKKSFAKIKELANLFDSHVHLLKIITPINFENSSESYKSMKSFAKSVGIEKCSFHTYNSISVEQGILSFSNDHRIDVLAIETHGRIGISHLINGSLAEDIANHANIPVLSVKMNNS